MESIVQHALMAGLALAIPGFAGSTSGTAVPNRAPAHRLAAAPLVEPASAAPAASTALAVRALPVPAPASHSRAALPAHEGAPGGACNGSLLTATLMPFSEHVNHAHFGRSPGRQAADVVDADTYTRTHTVLVETMTQPGRDDLFAISDATATPFLEHMYHAHFERSPMQQIGDLEQADSYVKLHTVLVEHMLQPALTALSGDC